MKKCVLAGILFSFLFFGCEVEETDYAGLLPGLWVNTLVDGEPILTDAAYVLEYRPDFVELYATGFQLNDSNKTWIENDNYRYGIEGNLLIIDGTNALEHDYHMEFEIISINQYTLSYSIRKFEIDSLDYPDQKTYTCQRATTDYGTSIVGIWYGHCTTEGTSDIKYHYWEYVADGSFNYYYQDANDHWIRKSDNEGGYFLYGNLLATNYSNDLISGGTGKAYECWNIDIDGDHMTWTGLRANNSTVTYDMNKVEQGPMVN
jgi:hypothetical protein